MEAFADGVCAREWASYVGRRAYDDRPWVAAGSALQGLALHVEVASGIPVLVRGGGRATDDEILNRTAQLMEQGAKGIVYGRNVIQHPNPAGMTRALMGVVHQGWTPMRAAQELSHYKSSAIN